MSKRSDGKGTVTPLGDGRFRARGPRQPDGSRPSLGIHETQEAADRAVDIGVVELRQSKRDGSPAFATVGESVLDDREKSGIRGISQERDRFRTHLAECSFAGMPVDRIAPADVTRWLRAMGEKRAMQGSGKKGRKGVATDRAIARSTITRALTLASTIFEAAGPNDRALIERNPCLGLKVPRRPGKEATKDVEVFLTLEEQGAVRACADIPDNERWLILFAFGSGVRMGEQHNLELRDVHTEDDEPHALLRFGSNGKPRKNGLKLRVPLFGFALEAARQQLELLRGQPNPLGLLFPTVNGHRRKGKPLGNGHFRPTAGGSHVLVSGKPVRVRRGTGTHRYVDRLTERLALAGITRHVRWHDLRHSCASSLLQGQWGDAWTIQEVKEQLGHSSVTVTERYAHLGETVLKKAAQKVRPVGHALVTGVSEGVPGVAAIFNDSGWSRESGLNRRPALYETEGLIETLRALAGGNVASDQRVTNLAGSLAALLQTL